MTYSTCSFNPIENEAVVAELLKRFPGCIEIEHPGDSLLGIKWRPGIDTWVVTNELGESLSDWSQSSVTHPTMWPPSELELKSSLRKCVRIMPHDNNTGGFFITLIRKTAEIPRPKWMRKGSAEYTQMPRERTFFPQEKAHTFREVEVEIAQRKDLPNGYRFFTRSRSRKSIFAVSKHLASHAFASIGSARLNIVSAGKKLPSVEGQ